jgi:endonuclease/exonuclease/phosphatase family metal-dependent hydrolase
MKKLLLIALCILTSTFFVQTQDSSEYTLLDWNLTHARKNDPKNIEPWKQRKDSVIEHITSKKRDFYTFQEVIDEEDQFKSLQEALPNYGWVGEKRNAHLKGSSFPWLWLVAIFAQDERCPIFYNKEKFELINSKTFDINTQNHEVKSVPRIATVACLKDLITKKELCICNCHLDHKSEAARTSQIKLIIEGIAKECAGKSIILTGDFNTTFDNDFKTILTQAGFVHGKSVAKKTNGPDVTHKKGSTQQMIECDLVFFKPAENFDVLSYETNNIISKKTSDHDSVSATFLLKE